MTCHVFQIRRQKPNAATGEVRLYPGKSGWIILVDDVARAELEASLRAGADNGPLLAREVMSRTLRYLGCGTHELIHERSYEAAAGCPTCGKGAL